MWLQHGTAKPLVKIWSMWQKKSHLVSLVERVDRSLHKAILAGHPLWRKWGLGVSFEHSQFPLDTCTEMPPPTPLPESFSTTCLCFKQLLVLPSRSDSGTLCRWPHPLVRRHLLPTDAHTLSTQVPGDLSTKTNSLPSRMFFHCARSRDPLTCFTPEFHHSAWRAGKARIVN